MNHLAQFLQILEQQNIKMVYQPVVSLMDGSVFGYEALMRGPSDTPFQSPEFLFQFAKKEGYLYQLEKLAREKAILGSILTDKKQLLFINISSPVIYDPQFISGKTLEILQQFGLNPNNVVFEITERSSIEDFSLAKKSIEHYRSQGYKIAIDDAGAGYSSLQAIAELHPDFIKVDRSLIHNIHKHKTKEYMLETFVTFAQKMNIHLIAEGIEHLEELLKLTKMGVNYALGYLLGHPQDYAVQINESLVSSIQFQKMSSISVGSTWTIRDLTVPIQTFDQSAIISDVSEYFNRNEAATGTVITTLDEKPVGIVMRGPLFRQLAKQYGYSLYWKRTIDHAMDDAPLIVDESLPIELVSQMAMAREKNKVYDMVIVTGNGKMAGVVSIQSILACITNERMESAREANPLTGLPGNIQIHRELQKMVNNKRPYSVIYADLDYFKWFNDRFGFQKGDQLIQYTADIIRQAISACDHQYEFIGHIGGDDFIAISDSKDPKQLCEEIIFRFDQGVGLFYEGDQWEYVEDRQGNLVLNDGVTLSLSLVICESRTLITLNQISQVAANLKKQAKSQRGSVYVCGYLGIDII